MDTQTVQCPYCGEWLEIVIDRSVRRQEYLEDCHICCRPITLTVTLGAANGWDGPGDDNGKAHVEARTEDA